MARAENINVEMNIEEAPPGSLLDRIKRQVNPGGHTVMEYALATLLLVLFITVVALAATHGGGRIKVPSDPACETDACLYRTGFLVSLMNRTSTPCDDFYKFACGSAARVLPLNPSLRERTISAEIMRRNMDKLEAILRSSIARNTPNSYERKLKTFFAKCVDDFLIEKVRGSVLALLIRPDFYVMNASVVDNFDLNRVLLSVVRGFGSPAFFGYTVAPNRMDANRYTISINSVSLGMLPAMYLFDFYKDQRDAYTQYIRLVSQQLVADAEPGSVQPGADARIDEFVADVMEIETELANITRTASTTDQNKQLDPANQVSLTDLNRLYPPIFWSSFFIQLLESGLQNSAKVAVLQPDYLKRLSAYIGERLIVLRPTVYRRMLSNYMHWQLIRAYTGDMSSAYVHAKREFEAALSSSTAVFPSRFDYCFDRATRFRQALNSLFVADHLVDQSKQAIDNIYKSLQTELIAAIDRLGWIDPTSRNKAKEKTRATVDKIGYSAREIGDSYLDEYYKEFQIESTDYLLDMLISWQNFARLKQGSLVGTQTAKTDWSGATYEVALRMTAAAELTVPAGILQWPMFSQQLPNYINYATIGQRIASELIKSIDATGQMTDLNGNINPSWSGETLLTYVEKAKCVNTSFSGLQAGPYVVRNRTYFVDMDPLIPRSLRQLIAESDALRMALTTYLGTPNSSLDLPLPLGHLDRSQSFFVAWAQSFCYTREPLYAYVRALLARTMPEDIHVNGILSMMPEFGRAFQCPRGSKMLKQACDPVFYR